MFWLKIVFLILIFIFGLIWGSFLNCLVWRLPRKKRFLFSRSVCPQCLHQLFWFDLIPLLSFILLKGKCRYCKKPISLQYPLVELACGLLFVLPFILKEFSIFPFFEEVIFFEIFYYFFLVFVLIAIFLFDLKYYIIPDKILLCATILTIFYYSLRAFILFFRYSYQDAFLNLAKSFLSAIFLSGFFLFLYLISKGKWIGFGDVKLGFFLGFLLSWPKIIVFLFLTYLIGGIIGLGLIVFKKKSLKSEIPFGPFLVVGAILTLFFGEFIIDWYLKLIK